MSDTTSNNLYNALQRLNRQMHRSRHRIMPPIEGLNRGQIRLLFLISKNDGIIQRDLADMMDIRPSSLTEMLSNLEEHSFILRKSDEKDRRLMHVYLTDAGRNAIEGFNQVNDKLSASIFNCLTTEESEKMLEMVNKINENLEMTNGTDEAQHCEKNMHHHHCHGHKNHHKHKHLSED